MNWTQHSSAIIIVILLLLLVYYYIKSKNSDGDSTSKSKKSKKSKSPKLSGGRRKSPKKGKTKARSKPPQEDDSEDETEEGNLQRDAEELYNMVHERLCNGIQQEEFEKLSGDLANTLSFIKLKQIYNHCIDRKMDPMTTITLQHYVDVLREND